VGQRGQGVKMSLKVKIVLIITACLGLAGYVLAAGSTKGKTETKKTVQSIQAEEWGKYSVTFIELGSVKCVPCKMMQPIMAEIEKDYAGQVKVVFHDVWTQEGQPFAAKYRIQAIPTQVFLDQEGKEFFRHMGFFPKEEIVKVLQTQGVK
jgi:thioredoxin 1